MRNLLMATAALSAVLAGGASAQDRVVTTAEGRRDLSITIYNENLALVRDVRRLNLPRGEVRLDFEDVSAQIRPETAALSGGRYRVIEQNFDYDLLSPAALLEKAVGEEVRIYRVNPSNGRESVEDATVLAANDGIVLRIGDRIEVMRGRDDFPGRIVFMNIPPNLRATPTLSMLIDNPSSGDAPLELAYLTRGLGWQADYVGTLNEDETALELTGLITLRNNAGVTFENALTQLVAGDVNQVRDEMRMREMEEVMATAQVARDGGVRQEGLLDYHLYTLPRRTTIADNQTKQVNFLNADEVAVEKSYVFETFGFQSFDKPRSVEVSYAFDNREASGLGMPLPRGVVRLYAADRGGRVQFVGEDRIRHTPKNEEVELSVGRAFDITVRGRTIENELISRTETSEVREITQEYTLKNGGEDAATVRVEQKGLWASWQILESNIEGERVDAATVGFDVDVPAEGETRLRFKLRLRR